MSQIPKAFYETASGKQLYIAYKGMKARCYGTSERNYRNYVARGITICDEWLASRDTFIGWALLNGFKVGLSLDRVDNDKGYTPDNCRWATQREQLLNQRRNRVVTFNGKSQPLSLWAEEIGVEFSAIWRRLERGLPLERVLQSGRLGAWRHGTRAGYESHKCRCELCTASNTLRHQIRREKRRNK